MGGGSGRFRGPVNASGMQQDAQAIVLEAAEAVAGIFGVLAVILPARRAARLNILHALQNG